MKILIAKKSFVSIELILAILLILLTAITGCAESAPYSGIPGVTQDEIDAVLELRNRGVPLIYASPYNTEAFINENGEIGGFVALLCEWLTELFGIPFQPEIRNPGAADFAGLIYGAESAADYMTEPIFQRSLKVMRHPDNPPSGTLADLTPTRYVMMDGALTGNHEAISARGYAEAYRMLEDGTADAIIAINTSEAAFDAYGGVIAEDYLPLTFFPVSMASRDPDLSAVISIVDKALQNGEAQRLAEMYRQGYREYKTHKFLTLLNDEERAYLRDNPVIPFATQYYAYPTSFYDEKENEWDGIVFDLLTEMEQLTGLSFELIHGNDVELPETIRLLENGTAYMTPNLVPTEERRRRFLQSENIYLSDRFALLSKRSFPNVAIYDIPYGRVGLVPNSAFTGIFLRWFPDAENIREYATTDDAFIGLNRGEVDLVMSSLSRLTSMNNYYGFSEYKANYLFNESFDFGFWFNDKHSALRSILDKAFPLIDVERIVQRWITVSYGYEEQLLRAQRPWLIGAVSLLFCVIMLIAVLLARSLSERDRLKELVALNTSTMTAIFDSAPDFIFCKDLKSRYTKCNKSMEVYFGIREEDIIGKGDSAIAGFSEELIAQFVEEDKRILGERKVLAFEEEVESLHGKPITFETIKAPIIQNGQVVGIMGISRDITERKASIEAAQKTVAEKETLSVMQNIFGGLDVMIHVTDPETDELLFVNDIMKSHYEIEGNFYGQLCYKVLRKDLSSRCDFCPCYKLEKDPDAIIVWEEYNEKTNRFYRNTSRYINWVDGRTAYLHQALDITDIKYELLKYELTREALRIGLWQIDVTTKDQLYSEDPENPFAFTWSQEFRRMLGFSDEEDFPNLFSSWGDRLHPQDREATLEALAAHINDPAGKTRYDVEYRLMVKDGKYRHFRAFGNTLRNEAGKPIRTAGAIEDIETEKQLQDSLKRREKSLESLNEMAVIFLSHSGETFEEKMTAGIFLTAGLADIDRMSIWRNSMQPGGLHTSQIYRWEKKLGGTTETNDEMQNVTYNNLVPSWASVFMQGLVINGPANSMPPLEEATLRRFGIVSVFAVPIFIGDSFWGFVLFEDHRNERFFDDNSAEMMRSAAFLCANTVIRSEMEREINDINEKLKNAFEEATSASRAKSDFLSHMSHEMRTPMNAIIGMTAIGKNASGTDQKDYALSKIEGASSHLLAVINDVLDMAKIEANRLDLSPVEFDFEGMLQKVISVINFRVEEKRQRLSVGLDKNIPRFIVGDDKRLSQVISNLLSNAVKFTPEEGNIRLNVSLDSESDGICQLKVEVIDNGIGISPEQQARLFRPFEQAESGTSREYGGTGLGLVISRSIIELMGGQIWIESEIGKGSRFIFTIKARLGEKNPRSLLADGVNWENVRILVVDDVPEVLEQFGNLFDNLKITFDTASDGFEACRIIEEKGAYDIYFIDWRMPNMDGIELTRRIKALNTNKPSVVIMITAMDWGAIKEDAYAAGVGKHLLKPLFSSSIIECLNECLGLPVDSKEKTDIPEDYFKGKRLLLAEDIEINREILITLLEDTGLIIDCAENGVEALDMIKAEPGGYDVVFMDVQMPTMDGLEATRLIRALPGCERGKLPIIAMTANVFKSDIDKCIEAGMDDHLGKPLVIDNVVEMLRKYLLA